MKNVLLYLLLINSTAYAVDSLTVGSNMEYRSINAAIAAADSGDVLLIKPGLYQEGQIEVNKPLTLLGEQYPAVEGSDENGVLLITSDYVTISGLLIQNVGTSYIEDRAGIKLDGVKNCHIINNRLQNCFFGIYLQKTSHSTISNNQVIGDARLEMSSGNAIHLWYCNNVEILDNLVSNHRDGLYLEFVDQSVIAGNISTNNLRYGLHFMFSNDDSYTHNRFESNGAGVAVMFSKNIVMASNQFINNWGTASYGLLLKEIYDGSITDNKFTQNTIGIYAESANRLKIENNDFTGNGWALKILGSCMDNTFSGNNFYTNTFDLTTNGPRDYNVYEKNYWSDYTGYDLDKDGFGDVPHRPVTLYSYLVGEVDVSILLLRSLFIDLLNFAEKVTPMFVPESLIDPQPLMKPRV